MLPESYYMRYKQGLVEPFELATLGCIHPKKVWILDGETSQYRQIPVACGTCYNCLNQRRKEWVSRMWCHSLDGFNHHCYFVTLTYGSYNLFEYDKHPFKNDWLATYPVCDSWNINHSPAWTPSIIRHEHLTKFLKRLRKNYDGTISYCGCGELGGRYGRPHFHLLLWSDKIITKAQLVEAWSLNCVQLSSKVVVTDNGKYDDTLSHFNFPIGEIDVVDLVKNGTLDLKRVKDETDDKSAAHCFSYVAKYIGKDFGNNSFPSKYAYYRYKNVFKNLPCSLNCTYYNPHWSAIPYLDEKDALHFHVEKKHDSYYWDMDEDYKPVLSNTDKSIDFNYNNIQYENIDFTTFSQICGTFFVCSRTYGIGRRYFNQNLARFKNGNYTLFEPQSQTLVFPSYFAKQVQISEYPIRFEKHTLQGTSFVKSSFQGAFEFYSQFRDDKNLFLAITKSNSLASPFYHLCGMTKEQKSHLAFNKSLVHDGTGSLNGVSYQGTFLDIILLDPINGRTRYFYDYYNDVFIGRKFNRFKRDWEFFECIDRIDFCDLILSTIQKRWSTLDDRQKRQEHQLELFDAIENDPRTPIARDNYIIERNVNQTEYLQNHIDPL